LWLAAAPYSRAEEPRKPPVPRHDDAPLVAPKTGKNFLVTNAVDAMLALPKRPEKREENWLKRKDFGRVPEYLERVKQEIEAEHDYIMHLLDQQQMEAQEGATRELTQEERDELIESLKGKWDEVNSRYQVIAHRKISTSNSTIGEIRWKEDCERQMSQLERDIERLSVKAPIYVSQ
jgi:hypothetical protein